MAMRNHLYQNTFNAVALEMMRKEQGYWLLLIPMAT